MTTTPDPMNLDTVETWVHAIGLGTELRLVRMLPGGTQNVMAIVEIDGRAMVLRQPPMHPRPHSNRALLRETTVLKALDDTTIPHPRVLAVHEALDTPDDRVFYLMEQVAGFNPGQEQPARYREDPNCVTAAGLEVTRVLADLGSLDPAALNLADLAQPDGFLRRQIERPLAAWQSSISTPGYHPEDLGDVTGIAAWLLDGEPPHTAPGLCHGDFHLDNVLLDPSRAAVAAVLDWEMCTVGDPLLDLGWLLVTWPTTAAPDQRLAGVALADLPGLPSPDQLIDTYRQHSARSVDHIDWYQTLAAFKLGLILESTYIRSLRGQAATETGHRLHAAAIRLLSRARGLTSQQRQ